MSARRSPPRWMERILERTLGDGLWGRAAVGDLAEAYRRTRTTRGRLAADVWYGRQAASLMVHHLAGWRGRRRGGAGPWAADVRWAVRVALRRPVTTLTVVLTLALGLGANAAVFSVIDGTFRASEWWADPDRTLVLRPGHGFSRGQLSIFQTDAPAFEAVGLYQVDAFTAAVAGGAPTHVTGVSISPALFDRLRVQPALGRGFLPEDAQPGGEDPVVVGHGFWQRELGGDPDVLGRRIEVNGRPRTVVGVQGRGGRAPGTGAELWIPTVLDPGDPDFFPEVSYTLVGVLRPSATAADGQETLRAFGRRLSTMFSFFYQPDYLQDATVRPATAQQRDLVRTPLLLLMGGAVALLLLAALNVGNLLMARAVERRRELALRRALGAARGRIVRQLATESALLAGLGAALGLAAAGPVASALIRLFPAEVAVVRSGWTSPAVAGVLAGAVVLVWVVLAGVPIGAFLAGERRDLDADIRPMGRPPRTLVVVQSALATLLLVAAAVLVQSVVNLRRVPLGFEPAEVTATWTTAPDGADTGEDRLRRFQDALVRGAAALPGVTAAGITSTVPLAEAAPATPVHPEDAPVDVSDAVQAARFSVGEGFVEALGIRLEAGRPLGSTERGDEPTAVVVNRALADRLWPGQDPVGRTLAIDPHAWQTFLPVVGVVSDFRADGLTGTARPAVFVSAWEQPTRRAALVVRSTAGVDVLAPAVRRLVADVDPSVPVGAVRPLASVVRDAYGTAWVTMGLLAAMAVLATALAALGIHAVLAHHVARRRRDIGVRMALGADRGRVVGRVLGSGLAATGLGVVLGCAVAVASVGLLESLLFGVTGLELRGFLLPAAAVLATATAAAWGPAVRAGRTPPAEALRAD